MDGKNTLMFASDYPHWDYDAVNKINIPDDWKENIYGNNALEVYKKIKRQEKAA